MSEEQKTTETISKKIKKTKPKVAKLQQAVPAQDAEKENLKRENEFLKNKVIAQNQIIGELYTDLKTMQTRARILAGQQ